MIKVEVESCVYCGTPRYSFNVPCAEWDRSLGSSTHECTSGGFTIHGGGECCATLGHFAHELTESEDKCKGCTDDCNECNDKNDDNNSPMYFDSWDNLGLEPRED
jgi:hypothetical protein